MGKSKSGGTRTYIRGRVGSDVYSIGRDAKGKKQQIVRSLAESVANPQTQAQMKGRMIMSTIAQALAVLRPIVDHSFDGAVGARGNLSEFTSRNYALIKADIAANPATGNKFGLVAYGERNARRGQYVIADGKASLPVALALTQASGIVTITLAADNITIGGLKAALGMSVEEYFTLVGMQIDGTALYQRFRINPSLADSTAITSDNLADIFATEGNSAAVVSLASNVIAITNAAIAGCCALIISKKSGGKFVHNPAVLGDGEDYDYSSNVALPTYPVGAENYLNGGDIFGLSETYVQGTASSEPSAETPSAIASVTVNGSTLGNGGQAVLVEGSNTVNANITAGTDSASYALGIVSGSQPALGTTVAAGDQTTITGNSVSKTFNNATTDSTRYICLVRDNKVIQVWGSLLAQGGGGDNHNPIDTGN